MNTEVSHSVATEQPVWFITGCSTGFGLELARQAIERGYRTVMTARDPSRLAGFGATENALVLKLDVTQPGQVAAAIDATQARFGAVDVLVNNAGIGYFAAIEEGEEAEVRKMFEVNVFGMSRMIQAVLPGMRKRRSGCIVNFSSIGGIPVRAAKAIVEAVASGSPPHHLLLGNDAFDGAMAKLDELRKDFTAGEAVARAADFPTSEAGAGV
jgi:NADP-dependent 3-hydroxy acid dehydrogenase YdfG